MFIVLSNVAKGKHMEDTQNTQAEPEIRPASDSRRAAAIEAAYILEAVRK
jgi:hypothetical protein